MMKSPLSQRSGKANPAVKHSHPKPPPKAAAPSPASIKQAPKSVSAPSRDLPVKHRPPMPPPKAAVPSPASIKQAPTSVSPPSPDAIRGRGHGAMPLSISTAPKASTAAPKAVPPQKAREPITTRERETPWTIEAASRIYKGTAQDSGGQVKKGTFSAAAMSEAMKASPPSKTRSK